MPTVFGQSALAALLQAQEEQRKRRELEASLQLDPVKLKARIDAYNAALDADVKQQVANMRPMGPRVPSRIRMPAAPRVPQGFDISRAGNQTFNRWDVTPSPQITTRGIAGGGSVSYLPNGAPVPLDKTAQQQLAEQTWQAAREYDPEIARMAPTASPHPQGRDPSNMILSRAELADAKDGKDNRVKKYIRLKQAYTAATSAGVPRSMLPAMPTVIGPSAIDMTRPVAPPSFKDVMAMEMAGQDIQPHLQGDRAGKYATFKLRQANLAEQRAEGKKARTERAKQETLQRKIRLGKVSPFSAAGSGEAQPAQSDANQFLADAAIFGPEVAANLAAGRIKHRNDLEVEKMRIAAAQSEGEADRANRLDAARQQFGAQMAAQQQEADIEIAAQEGVPVEQLPVRQKARQLSGNLGIVGGEQDMATIMDRLARSGLNPVVASDRAVIDDILAINNIDIQAFNKEAITKGHTSGHYSWYDTGTTPLTPDQKRVRDFAARYTTGALQDPSVYRGPTSDRLRDTWSFPTQVFSVQEGMAPW